MLVQICVKLLNLTAGPKHWFRMVSEWFQNGFRTVSEWFQNGFGMVGRRGALKSETILKPFFLVTVARFVTLKPF